MRLVFTALLLTSTAYPVMAKELHSYDSLTLSAAGDKIASVESVSGDSQLMHDKIVVRSARDGRILRSIDPCVSCSYSGLTFGPEGTLAWLQRDPVAGTTTLAIDETRRTRTIATIKGIAQSPRFSPNGERIALLVTVGAAKESGAVQPGAPRIGEIGKTSDEQRIAVFDLGAKAVTEINPLSPADRYVYEYDWTPDGKGFVTTSALGNGDDNWWVATLDAIDATTGAVRNIARPNTQITNPRVSPDGKTVAYIGGLMSDFGPVGGDVWTVPFAGGDPVNITRGDKATVNSLAWTKGGIRDTRRRGADAQIAELTPGKGSQIRWTKPASFNAGEGNAAFDASGSVVALVVEDFEHAPAIYAGPQGAPRKITNDNDSFAPVMSAKNITWKNDGYDVQGWLIGPRAAPSAKAPMIVFAHGGPSNSFTPFFALPDSITARYVNAGYYVFFPNPRGSFGQGQAFTAANKRDFGGGDLRDILTGIDAVEKVAPIDDDRLGLAGSSYGGFMAMWANTQTNRFKAIVAGAGISNWVSYYGTNGIDQWMIPFFGRSAYDDPEAYMKVSAITHIKKARTPTLIYAGERDIEVPPGQSIEYWHALRELGIPTTLMIYPGEGHRIAQPVNAADLNKRVFAWWAKYLGK